MDHVQQAVLTSFLPGDTWSVMSHFKFVSTINAAEEGCTHSLVLGNRRLRLDTQGLRRASTWNHHPCSSRRASRRLHSLGCSSVGASEPQIQRFPSPVGPGQAGGEDREQGCTREAWGTKWCHEGHHWHKPPWHRADTWGESRRAAWGAGGSPAGTQGTPCSSELPTKGMCLSQIHRSYVQVSAESETVNYSWKCCPPATHSTPPRWTFA